MSHQRRSPRGGHQRGLAENRSNSIVGRTHPFCKWYETAFVDDFPKSCPCRGSNPLNVLTEYRDIGWKELGNSGTCFNRGDVRGALDLLNHIDVCNRCLADGMLAHPSVRRLRQAELGRVPE